MCRPSYDSLLFKCASGWWFAYSYNKKKTTDAGFFRSWVNCILHCFVSAITFTNWSLALLVVFFRIVSKAKIEASSAKTSIWIEDALINHLLLYQRIKLYECKILRETDIYIEKFRTIWKTGNLKLFFGINS